LQVRPTKWKQFFEKAEELQNEAFQAVQYVQEGNDEVDE